jgi:hypothetical protein
MTPEEIAAKEAADAAAKAAEDKAAEDAKNKGPETFTVKISGEDKQLTLEEITELASKSAGADEKFRNAAQMKEDAEKGIEIGKAFEKINSGKFDATDVRKLAELTGQDADEAVTSYNAELKKTAGDDKDKDKDKSTPAKKLEMKDLPEDVQEIINSAKESQIEDAQKKVEEMVGAEVAKDDFLGKIVIDAPEELREGIKEVVISMVQRDVQKKILASPYTKEKFGAEMIRNSIQTARADIKKLGIPSKASKQADRVSLLASLGPSGNGLPAEVYSDDKIKRVDSNDPGYEDNAVARLGQALRQKKTEA